MTVQRRRSYQYFCSIQDYVVPTAVCTHVLYTLTVQLSCDQRSDHWIHPGNTQSDCQQIEIHKEIQGLGNGLGDTTHHTHITHHTHTLHIQSQMFSSGSPTKNREATVSSNLDSLAIKHILTSQRTVQDHTGL